MRPEQTRPEPAIDDRAESSTTPQQACSESDVPHSMPATLDEPLKFTDDKIYEPYKKRFFDASSSITFPRALALSLKVGQPPRIHSFAYNVGTTPEQFFSGRERKISEIVGLDEARQHSQRFFDTVNVLFPIVHAEEYYPKLDVLWTAEGSSMQFETLVCFAVLLGSHFSWPNLSVSHEELTHHAQALLDRANFHDAPSLLHIEHAQAWVLRTIYLRCTTRPNITWISSSICMHVMESLGLHREYDTLENLNLNVHAFTAEQLELRRRIFWTAWTVNRMVAFEVGRTATCVAATNIKLPGPEAPNSMLGAIDVYRLLYPEGGHTTSGSPQECLESLSAISTTDEPQDVFLRLVRAEAACGLYREVHKTTPLISERTSRRLITITQQGLHAARSLMEQSQPWWMLTSLPFQFICVAVAMGQARFLDMLPEAMSLLHDVNRRFETHMTEEACQTARLLLDLAIQNRDKQVSSIQHALDVATNDSDRPSTVLEGEDWDLYFGSQIVT